MKKRILVTGVNGFVGKHLARELHGRGHEVMGVSREPRLTSELSGIVTSYYVCDLTKEADVKALPLANIDAVINLAGFAQVGSSFANPDLYMQVNVGVLSVIGRRLVDLSSPATMLAISTGAVYDANQSMPLTETSTLVTGGSPYALSKIAMEKEAAKLRSQGLNCVVIRPFNHIGPGQEAGFLVPDLVKKIYEASKHDSVLKVGNLSTRRDYTDVRDVVKAYAGLALAEKLDHDIYNVCSGRSIKGEKILTLLLEATGQTGKITVQPDPSLIRPNDPKDLYGSNKRLNDQCGWRPTIPLKQTILDFVASA